MLVCWNASPLASREGAVAWQEVGNVMVDPSLLAARALASMLVAAFRSIVALATFMVASGDGVDMVCVER